MSWKKLPKYVYLYILQLIFIYFQILKNKKIKK